MAENVSRAAVVTLVGTMAAALIGIGAARADDPETCKMTLQVLPEHTTYTQQHVIDVGDVPGHQVRLLELRRIYPADTGVNCEGLKRVESWRRGYSDYPNGNGEAWGYGVVVMENGDKIYTQWRGTSFSTIAEDGSQEGRYTGTARITGGTGRYAKIRGLERDRSLFNPEKNFNETIKEIEYWFEE